VKPDELFYDWKDIIMKINTPKLKEAILR